MEPISKHDQIKHLLNGYYSTIGCGICKYQNSNMCRYCDNHRSTHIMWTMEEKIQDDLIESIIDIFYKE